MIFRSLFYLIIILLFPVNSLKSQEIQFYSSSNIISMLDKLDVFGKVLYVAAHPDDENTRLIAYLSNEMKFLLWHFLVFKNVPYQVYNLIFIHYTEANEMLSKMK